MRISEESKALLILSALCAMGIFLFNVGSYLRNSEPTSIVLREAGEDGDKYIIWYDSNDGELKYYKEKP